MRRTLRFLSHVLFFLVVLSATLWALGAIWFHLHDRALIIGLWSTLAAACAILALRFQRRALSWTVLAVAVGVITGWYMSLSPRQDRDWAFDVARGATARIEGERVTLGNVRDFLWRSETSASGGWRDITVDLGQITSVDLITARAEAPARTQSMVSFGFADDQHLVFSLEPRRQKDQPYDDLAGAFRRYELILIAATESDILRHRAAILNDTLHLAPVDLAPDQRRALFLAYAGLAQQLQQTPAFYNSVLAKGPALLGPLSRVLAPGVPADQAGLLSGRLPAVLGRPAPETATVLAAAATAPAGPAYSRAIRAP